MLKECPQGHPAAILRQTRLGTFLRTNGGGWEVKEPLSRREFLKRGVIAGTALSASSIGAWSIGSSIARADAVRPALDPDALRKFGASLKGGLILPKDPSYEAARHIRNARYDKRPSVIVRCAATEDVVRAVEFAHKSNLAVAVRSGGHDLAGYSTCDDGLVIDLGGMRSAIVDSDKQSIRVQTGLSVGEFYKALEAHGLGTNAGECASVGMGGLTLGGGEGMLMGKYGMACDNVVSAEIVTAAGHVLKANAHKNADLFWAIRGGGGDFGVVTSVEFRAYPVSRLLAGSVIHPLSKARDVLRFYRDLIATAPDELTSGFTMTALPSAEPSIAIDVCYCGNADDGEKVLKRLRSFGSPVKDTIKARSLSEAMLMEEPPAGLISHARGGFVQNLSDASISALLLHLDETP